MLLQSSRAGALLFLRAGLRPVLALDEALAYTIRNAFDKRTAYCREPLKSFLTPTCANFRSEMKRCWRESERMAKRIWYTQTFGCTVIAKSNRRVAEDGGTKGRDLQHRTWRSDRLSSSSVRAGLFVKSVGTYRPLAFISLGLDLVAKNGSGSSSYFLTPDRKPSRIAKSRYFGLTQNSKLAKRIGSAEKDPITVNC